jgi:hypothetical protein
MGPSLPQATDSYAVIRADSCRSGGFLVTNLVTGSLRQLRGTPPIRGFARTGQAAFSCSWFESRYPSKTQTVLEEAGWASEVFLKYSYIGDAMR